MKTELNRYAFDRPKRRPLKIYATDPMAGKSLGNRARVDVENEQLQPGPSGRRVTVVDFNASTGSYYPPVDLDDPNLLMQGGLEPMESDPRFHQQMVYAVAMRTLENFDRALGRRIHVGGRNGKPLRLFPHAFNGANAYFDPELNAVLFGYFRADKNSPGENLPGQTVFTCLSHDIIAHEMTHAVVHRLRRHFLEPSNVDVLAFHEGFSDLVALFQHFSFPEILRDQVQKAGSNLRTARGLLELAQQFGHATATGKALRSAIGDPGLKLTDQIWEPHERGAILVAAVFDAFIKVYERRTADLLRLVSDGRDRTSHLHPDLVNRLAGEAAKIAQSMLTICIRAFDYMPPVDVTFGDFLRAIVTADMELSPDDELGLRAALIEGFRLRGIYPDGVTSLAEESLLWEPANRNLPKLQWDSAELLAVIVDTAANLSTRSRAFESGSRSSEESSSMNRQYAADCAEGADEALSELSKAVHAYATANARELMLDPNKTIQASGVHPVFRVAPSGRLAIELVAQVSQADRETERLYGGIPARGGTTLIVDFDGTVRYAIAKPLPGGARTQRTQVEAQARLERQAAFVEALDFADPGFSYLTDSEMGERSKMRASFKALHIAR